jgi:hypothetical protein
MVTAGENQIVSIVVVDWDGAIFHGAAGVGNSFTK